MYSLSAAAVAVVFLWSGVAKFLRLRTWRAVLEGYRLPGPAALLFVVPLTELVVPGLVVAGASRAGAALALALLGGFSAAIVRARALQGDKLPCGCFGRADARDYRFMLGRNALLGLLSAIAIARGRDMEFLEGLGAPESSDIVPVVLVALGLVAIVLMLRAVGGASSDASSDLRRGGR